MSSRSSSIESYDSSSLGPIEDRPDEEEVAEPPPPRPTREEYHSYAALVHSIDRGDTLVAKRIIATHIKKSEALETDTRSLGAANSSAWPLRTSDLPKQYSADALEESILAFASAYIREHDLVLPRHQQFTEDDQLDSGVDDLEDALPNLLPDMMDKVDRLLNSLAVMRPAAVKKKRQNMKPMSWSNVLAAGMLGGRGIEHEVLLESNTKIRKMLQVQGEDLLEHRIRSIHGMDTIPAAGDKAELPEVPKRSRKGNTSRPHQSQQEREERAAKRERRAARREERAQAKAALEATKSQSSSKSTKRRRRRHAKS